LGQVAIYLPAPSVKGDCEMNINYENITGYNYKDIADAITGLLNKHKIFIKDEKNLNMYIDLITYILDVKAAAFLAGYQEATKNHEIGGR
jgi:hypothetical protein